MSLNGLHRWMPDEVEKHGLPLDLLRPSEADIAVRIIGAMVVGALFGLLLAR